MLQSPHHKYFNTCDVVEQIVDNVQVIVSKVHIQYMDKKTDPEVSVNLNALYPVFCVMKLFVPLRTISWPTPAAG